ncbi:MAG: cation-transporting P-type ATPase [Nitrospirae bacterium]|nr:cation-transporting P-type ATPase [Nitrospirota bacterium]
MTGSRPEAASWHAQAPDAALDALHSQPGGLSGAEAAARLARHGANRLRPPQRRGPLGRFATQFHNVIIYVLLVAGAVTIALGHWVDSGVILGVVLVNALIGFMQEGKAERAIDAIREMLSPQAAVWRDGRYQVIPAEGLVPGDVVMLQPGDRVPADLRLLQVRNLRVDEAVLTGESAPVEKGVAAVAADAMLADRTCMAYSGTLVTGGQGTALVVATGDGTEIGRISALLRAVQTLSTPLLRQVARFSRWLTAAIVAVASATFLFGVLFRGYTSGDMFIAAVGLAVAAIPEGLPAIMTITLAIGVQRMARRNAIIRRLPAVETLGSVTVICSDKTGTLTRNEMTVRSVATGRGPFQVTGVGYDPHGSFRFEDRDVTRDAHPVLGELTRAALLCNDAHVEMEAGHWIPKGDPTEAALVVMALKAGLDPALERERWPRTDVIPFASENRYMATLHHDRAGRGFVYVKGAPEELLRLCSRQREHGEDHPLDAPYWEHHLDRMAAQGERLLAIAFRATGDHHRMLTPADLEEGLTLLGLVGIIDPPREEAIRAVGQCRAAGIRVKMITGDHARTAAAVAAQLGIGAGGAAVTGHALDAMDERGLAETVRRTDVFARTSPEHKLRLVTALQAQGEVVAMTGDGVNDAPALKRADVGIAMGLKGTEVSKEAAEVVLADDNFASIANAVEEGRTVYDNLRKAILFILPTNGGEALTLIAAIAMGRMLPITPVQILWINMITAVTLALALAFEPAEGDVMRRPPRDPGEPLLSRLLIWRIVFVSLILVAGAFGLFLWERAVGGSIAAARTVAVNTLVMFEVFYLFNTRYLTAPVLNRAGLFGNPYALVAVAVLLLFQMGMTYLPPAQALFGTAAIGAGAWGRIMLVSASVLILVEIEKALLRRWAARRV